MRNEGRAGAYVEGQRTETESNGVEARWPHYTRLTDLSARAERKQINQLSRSPQRPAGEQKVAAGRLVQLLNAAQL